MKLTHQERQLEELYIKGRTINVLRRNRIGTIEDLTDLTEEQLKSKRGIGEKMFFEIKFALAEEGLRLKRS